MRRSLFPHSLLFFWGMVLKGKELFFLREMERGFENWLQNWKLRVWKENRENIYILKIRREKEKKREKKEFLIRGERKINNMQYLVHFSIKMVSKTQKTILSFFQKVFWLQFWKESKELFAEHRARWKRERKELLGKEMNGKE